MIRQIRGSLVCLTFYTGCPLKNATSYISLDFMEKRKPVFIIYTLLESYISQLNTMKISQWNDIPWRYPPKHDTPSEMRDRYWPVNTQASAEFNCFHLFNLLQPRVKQPLLKLVSHRGRGEYGFTRSGQIPVLVNFAKLLVGFPINRNQFVATSCHFGAAVEIFWKFQKFHREYLPTRHSCPLPRHHLFTSRFYWFTSRYYWFTSQTFMLTSSTKFEHDWAWTDREDHP